MTILLLYASCNLNKEYLLTILYQHLIFVLFTAWLLYLSHARAVVYGLEDVNHQMTGFTPESYKEFLENSVDFWSYFKVCSGGGGGGVLRCLVISSSWSEQVMLQVTVFFILLLFFYNKRDTSRGIENVYWSAAPQKEWGQSLLFLILSSCITFSAHKLFILSSSHYGQSKSLVIWALVFHSLQHH